MPQLAFEGRVDDELSREIGFLRQKGFSIVDISRKTGVPYSVVKSHAEKYLGVQVETSESPEVTPKSPQSRHEMALRNRRLREGFISGEYTIGDISSKFQWEDTYVLSILSSRKSYEPLGTLVIPRGDVPVIDRVNCNRKETLTEEISQEVRERFFHGESLGGLAEDMHLPESLIVHVLRYPRFPDLPSVVQESILHRLDQEKA